MDILKVLSRGTKKSAKGQQASGSSKSALNGLPSAGIKTNPQLYHDEVRGQKRKRVVAESAEATDEDLPVVDFFAPQNETPVNKPTAGLGKAKRAPSPAPKPAKRLSEEECRQLLRSHRLKMTLLSKKEEKKVEKKKSKKKKKAEEETKKDDKKQKQLFPQPLESFGELRST